MDIKKDLYSYLQTQFLMGLSTHGDEMWPAIVYYIADKDLNLYFISHPDDLHAKNITINPTVTCTIYDSTQVNSGDKIGIQYRGRVKVVNVLEKVKWMVKLWNKLIAGEKGFRPNPKDMLKAGGSRVYKITPQKIKFFNSKLYTGDHSQVIKY